MLAAWLLLLVGGTVVIRPDIHTVAYVVYDSILTAVLLAIVVVKGERLR